MWTQEGKLSGNVFGRGNFASVELFRRYIVFGRKADWFLYDRKAMEASRLDGRFAELEGQLNMAGLREPDDAPSRTAQNRSRECAPRTALAWISGGILQVVILDEGSPDAWLSLTLPELSGAISEPGARSRFLASLELRNGVDEVSRGGAQCGSPQSGSTQTTTVMDEIRDSLLRMRR